MAKLTIPKLESSTFKGWTFVLVAGVALALLALIDAGGGTLPADAAGVGQTSAVAPADGSTGCVVEVVTEELNLRAGPSQNAELLGAMPQGARVDATTVVTDGFRQLEDGRWASNQYLTPLAGTTCS
jgi:hypothetical protein